MAYHKSKLVRAHLDSQEQLIISTAIALIGKGGMEHMTAKRIARDADISAGKVFHYFADMAELTAKVEATIMARDMAAIESAAKQHETHPNRALTAAVLMLFVRFSTRASREMMIHGGSYRLALARQLSHLVGAVIERADRFEKTDGRMLARAALGAIFELAGTDGPSDKRVSLAVLFVLGAVGIPAATAQAAMDAVEKV